ncbi:MAG: FKBP-type peptidyl-prolyl cis-trans isomerase [Pseudomonadota bacterium]
MIISISRSVILSLVAMIWTCGAQAQEAAPDANRDAEIRDRIFVKRFAEQPDIRKLPSGILVREFVRGTGSKPTIDDAVQVHYVGKLTNGTIFDSSRARGRPSSFDVAGVIEGWTAALLEMPKGARWEIVIPSELAYGERGAPPDIPPNAVLVFDVELLDIAKGPPPNPVISSILATEIPAFSCGEAPKNPAIEAPNTAWVEAHNAGLTWQDCAAFYLRDLYTYFNTTVEKLRFIEPGSVAPSQRIAVNEYFQKLEVRFTKAEQTLADFPGIASTKPSD